MDQLGRAGEAMGDAEGQLGQGNADGAVNSQGRALEALRRGAQNLAQSMQQQGMMGPGANGQPGKLGPPRAQQETDPLGRPLRGRDYGDDTTVKVPGEIDVQRARRILEELRRRFGENFRPQLDSNISSDCCGISNSEIRARSGSGSGALGRVRRGQGSSA